MTKLRVLANRKFSVIVEERYSVIYEVDARNAQEAMDTVAQGRGEKVEEEYLGMNDQDYWEVEKIEE